MLRLIAGELREHAPFTALGAVSGIIVMVVVVFVKTPPEISHDIFYTLHPLHVLLSALVTTAMYLRYGRGRIWAAVLVGYAGSIGIATVSDVVIPYLGAVLLRVDIGFHVPFIEEWWLVNPLALVGIAIAFWKQVTKLPHWGHVLLSTWASLFYLTAFGMADWLPLLPFVFLFLFLAVWLPCCLSDIVFPLLFAGKSLAVPPHVAYNQSASSREKQE